MKYQAYSSIVEMSFDGHLSPQLIEALEKEREYYQKMELELLTVDLWTKGKAESGDNK